MGVDGAHVVSIAPKFISKNYFVYVSSTFVVRPKIGIEVCSRELITLLGYVHCFVYKF